VSCELPRSLFFLITVCVAFRVNIRADEKIIGLTPFMLKNCNFGSAAVLFHFLAYWCYTKTKGRCGRFHGRSEIQTAFRKL